MKNSNLIIKLSCMFTIFLLSCMVKLKAQNDLTGYAYLGTYWANNHDYYISNCETTWEEANDAATEMGGYLATISNYSENNFLQNVHFTDAWIGLRGENGIYEWANGETVSWTFWNYYGVINVYEPFYADGATLMHDGFAIGPEYIYWISHPISGEFKYIVEFPSQPNCSNNPNKAYVCHNGNTICVNISALQSHLDHGDLAGPCGPCNTNAMQILPDNEAVMAGHDQQPEMEMISTPQEDISIAHDRNQLYVYPNPASSEFHVVFPEANQQGTLRILSLTGQEIYSLKLKGQQSFVFDLTTYASGLYLVDVRSTNGQYQKKIAKL